MKISVFGYILILSTIFGLNLQAQVVYQSYYSRLGQGDLRDNGLYHVQHSGWLSSTYSSPYNVNHHNPASYAHLTMTAFDIGFDVSRNNIDIGTADKNYWHGGANHVSLAFPLINPLNKLLDRKERKLKLGFALTLVPYSRVGYRTDILDSTLISGTPAQLPYIRQYDGSGGSYRLFGGLGASYKNISLGFNAGYHYGSIDRQQANNFPTISGALHDYYETSEKSSAFFYNIGLMYDLVIEEDLDNSNNNKILTIGLRREGRITTEVTGDQLHILKGNGFMGLDDPNTILPFEDTVSYSSVTSDMVLPSSWGMGLRYRYKSKWSLGIDYEHTSWEDYRNDFRPEALKNTYKISTGIEYVKDEGSYTSLMDRIRYRAGFRYETDPRSELGQQLSNVEARVGISIPTYFSRQISFINLGFGYGKVTGNNTSSRTTRLDIGFTLNDNLWFYKRRFD